MAKDYYKILGVSKDATEDQIKKAYRKLAALVQFNGIFRINRPEPFENTAHYRKAGDTHNRLILPVFPLN